MADSDPGRTEEKSVVYFEMDVDSDVEAINRVIEELGPRIDGQFTDVTVQIGVPEEHRGDLEAYLEEVGNEYEPRLRDERKDDGSSGRPGARR